MDFNDRSNAEAFLKMVESADIIFDTNTYDPVGRLGVDYHQIMADNPGLIWCTITNFGFGRSATTSRTPT